MSLENMKKRINYYGGSGPDARIVKAKYNSFKYALNNSYQAEWIEFKDKKYRCLINPDRLNLDYDEKEISIDYECGLQVGDTIYWNRTDSYWIVYLQRIEEEAYFRGLMRQCDAYIEVNGNKYWLYMRGPTESTINWSKSHDIYFNDLNYTLMFFIKQNEDTLDYFKRFKKIKLDGHNWEVQAVDKYSQPGLLEVYLKEDFDNEFENAESTPSEEQIQISEPYIDGPRFVKPYDTNLVYTIKNSSNGSFIVSSNKVKIVNMDSTSCTLEITSGKSGKFNLIYSVNGVNITSLEVIIESL